MAQGLRQIAALPDPSARRSTSAPAERPGDLTGPGAARVIGFVYESRPNVTADAAGLCLKSGNAVVLRGGSEATESNALIAAVLVKSIEKVGAPADAIQFIENPDRAAVLALLEMDRYLDLIIPRGGEAFVRLVAERARVPVLKHDKGLVHIYVDAAADVAMAVELTDNAKTQRPGVCNAVETLLVHHDIAAEFLPAVAARLAAAGVELRGCPRTLALVPSARPARDEDWDTEYLDLILAVKVVDDLDEAIRHIRRHGSAWRGHRHQGPPAGAPVHPRGRRRRRPCQRVDPPRGRPPVRHGGGDGHLDLPAPRSGPVGLEELTTTKFVVQGDGQVRE